MTKRFLDRLRELSRTPEGARLFTEARKLAKDPATRERIDEARRDLAGAARARRRTTV